MSSNFVSLIKKAAVEAVAQLHPSNIFFGTVVQEKKGDNELIIETDDKLVLPEYFLVLSRNVTDYNTWISFDDEETKQRIKIFKTPEDEPVLKPSDPEPEEDKITDIQFIWTDYKKGFNVKSPDGQKNEEPGKQPTKHIIKVYNHLMLDERVILIRQQGGQKFFVMDRIGEMGSGSK